MVVSLLWLLLDLPEASSLKDKRRIVASMKERVISKYHVAAAEVGRNDVQRSCEFGCALVSNSASHGESVMQRVREYVETSFPVAIRAVELYSEHHGPSRGDS